MGASVTPERLTRCPFIPGRPAVPGNPRAPWRERQMRTWKGVRRKVSVTIAPKRIPSEVSLLGPPSHHAHLRPRRSTLTRTAGLASFPLQRDKKAHYGNAPLSLIEGWIQFKGSNLTSNLKLSLDLQWHIHFHICLPRTLKPGLFQGMERDEGEDAGGDGGCLAKTFYSVER